MLEAATYCIAMSVAQECGDSAATINSNEEFMSGTAATSSLTCTHGHSVLSAGPRCNNPGLLLEAPYSMLTVTHNKKPVVKIHPKYMNCLLVSLFSLWFTYFAKYLSAVTRKVVDKCLLIITQCPKLSCSVVQATNMTKAP